MPPDQAIGPGPAGAGPPQSGPLRWALSPGMATLIWWLKLHAASVTHHTEQQNLQPPAGSGTRWDGIVLGELTVLSEVLSRIRSKV